jgi:hypothetical protein
VRLIHTMQSYILIKITFRLKDALVLPSTADALADLPDLIASLTQ